MKVLDDDPSTRYESVERLAEDVRRHLSGHPVLAREGGFAYSASKFVRRNKLVAGAAAIALSAMVIAFGVTLREKQIAERRFEQLRSLARAVVFDIHDAIAPLPGSTRAREILVRQALVYLDNLAKESADNTPLQMELASAYLKIGDVQGRPYQPNLGDTKGALDSYRKALTIAAAAAETEPESDALRALVADAHDRIGTTEQRALDWPAAMREHQASLAIRRSLRAPTPKQQLDLAATWVAIGDAAYIGAKTIPTQWRQWSGEEAYQQSLAVLATEKPTPELRGDFLVATARAHQRLGGYYSNARHRTRDPQLPIRHHDAALQALAERVALDPSSGTARRNYADQHVMKATAQNAIGDHEGALVSTRQAIVELTRLAAADAKNVEAQHDIAFAFETAARAQFHLGRFDEAETSYSDALAILKRLTDNDPTNREDLRGMIGITSRMAELRKKRGDLEGHAAMMAQAERLRTQIKAR
jgi:tetratricopeptide (TPR) repeat protein